MRECRCGNGGCEKGSADMGRMDVATADGGMADLPPEDPLGWSLGVLDWRSIYSSFGRRIVGRFPILNGFSAMLRCEPSAP